MGRKKILAAGLLCSLFLTGIIQRDTVYAASPSLSASADTGSVAQGDYVNIDVQLSNNPDISTLGAALNYDNNVLKYDSSTWNSGFSGSDMQMASDTGSEVNLSVVCDDSYAQDGTVVTVRFQAVSDADSIPVTLSLRDMADASLSEVSDCTVASAVRAPEGKIPESADQSDETDMVDLDDPEAASGISIVDEASDGQPEDAASIPEAQAAKTQATVTDTSGGTGSESNGSASMAQGAATGGTQAAVSSGTVRPDSNYKTGIGLGSDALLVGAAAFGVLALVLAVRRH